MTFKFTVDWRAELGIDKDEHVTFDRLRQARYARMNDPEHSHRHKFIEEAFDFGHAEVVAEYRREEGLPHELVSHVLKKDMALRTGIVADELPRLAQRLLNASKLLVDNDVDGCLRIMRCVYEDMEGHLSRVYGYNAIAGTALSLGVDLTEPYEFAGDELVERMVELDKDLSEHFRPKEEESHPLDGAIAALGSSFVLPDPPDDEDSFKELMTEFTIEAARNQQQALEDAMAYLSRQGYYIHRLESDGGSGFNADVLARDYVVAGEDEERMAQVTTIREGTKIVTRTRLIT